MHDDFLTQLSNLSEKELREVRSRVSILLGEGLSTSSSTTDSGKRDAFEGGFYGLLQGRLSNRGVSVPPLFRIKGGKFGSQWSSGVRTVEKFISDLFGVSNRTETLALSAFLIDRLLAWLDARGIVVVFYSVVSSLDRIPGIVEGDFPGYRQNGLLSAVVRRLLNPQPPIPEDD